MYNAHLIITYMFLKEKLQKLKKCSEIPIHSVVKKQQKKPPKIPQPRTSCNNSMVDLNK